MDILQSLVSRSLVGQPVQGGNLQQDADKIFACSFVDADVTNGKNVFYTDNDISEMGDLASTYKGHFASFKSAVIDQDKDSGIKELKPQTKVRIKGAMLIAAWIEDEGDEAGYVHGTIGSLGNDIVKRILQAVASKWDQCQVEQANIDLEA